MLNILIGKKTYIVALSMVLYEILGYLLGKTQTLDVKTILEGMGLAALRNAIKIIPLALFLTGCLATNMSEYAKAIASDPANICVAVSTPYGGGVVGRVNTPGAKLNASGGQCNIEVPK